MIYHFIAFSAAVATGAADADCVGYFYKINGVCTGVQQFPGATGCGAANGGKDSHPLTVDKAFCQEFGTARVSADQQVPGVSWGNLGKGGAAEYVGEVNDPTLPSGCVAHSNKNTYQWNNAANGASYQWWAPVCMTDEMPAPSAPPSTPPAELTKCKDYTPDRAMSMRSGTDSVAVQLCKVINGNVVSPMWDHGKASDCGTSAALITASTNSIHDCMALCDAHVDCVGWALWDQSTLPAPFTKDDQGCYLYENGTADQLVPDRVMDIAVAAGVCFPEEAPGTEMPGCCRGASGVGIQEYLNVASAKDCYDMCFALRGDALKTYEYGFDTPAAGNTAKRCWCYMDVVATHSDTTSDPRCAVGARSCFVLGSDSTPSAPPTTPSAPPTAPSAPPTTHAHHPSAPPSAPPADNTDCQKVQLKSGDKCLHTQGPNATSMWMTCPAPGTNDPLFQFEIIPVDPTTPDQVYIRNSAGQYVSFQSPWMDAAMTRDLSSMYHQVWERRVSSAGVQFYNAGRGAFLASDPAVNGGFAGFTTTDSATASTFAPESAGCADSTPSAPPTTPSAPPTTPSAPPTDTHAHHPSAPPSAPPADNTDCQKVQLKSGDKCLHTQGPNATSMWMTCPAPGTNDPLFQFDIIPVDPANPDQVYIRNSAGQYVSFQSPWMDPAMTRDLSSMYHQVWEQRVSSAGVQFYNAGRGAFLASDPAVNGGFAGFTTTDSATASTFAPESAGCAATPKKEGGCRLTDSTFAEGARCIGPAGETIGYRQTANWCCSDYGHSMHYRWVNGADDVCHDDDFVGTCMFNFVQAGGCDMTGSDDTIMASVDPDCFNCDHIGILVEHECNGAPTALHILSDMKEDARRLEGTPLPTGDDELKKINKRISKIRSLLKDKKTEAKTALGTHP